MVYSPHLSESDRQWFDRIHQYRTSGKSDSQWLLENDIKSPTFYYHVKQLRKKACDIPENIHSGGNDIQEVVPLFVEGSPPITSEPMAASLVGDVTAVRLNIQGITVEITNNATQDVIQNTLAAFRFLC